MSLHRRSLLLSATVAVAFVIAWSVQHLSVASLHAEVGALQGLNSDAAQLQRENARLRSLQPEPEEQATLRKAADEHAKLERDVSSRVSNRPAPATIETGRAVLATDWKARGQDTPFATIETLLAAAAGGDIASLQPLLQLDPDIHARAAALLARQPDTARALYPTPEQLIAAFTLKNIPLGSAQVAWHEETKPGFAEALLYLRELPQHAVASTSAITEPQRPNDPPSLFDTKITKAVHLNFQHGPNGWRVVVPPAAVEKIERELAR